MHVHVHVHVCDQLTEEMTALKKKKRESETELKFWMRKVQKSTWYNRRKNMSTSETENDNDVRQRRSITPQSPVLSSPTPSPRSSVSSPPLFLCSTPSSSSHVDLSNPSPLMAHPLSPIYDPTQSTLSTVLHSDCETIFEIDSSSCEAAELSDHVPPESSVYDGV